MTTTPLSEKKLLKTEKVKTSDEVQKSTEKITTSRGVDKGTGEVHKRTNNITTNEEVDKGYENWNIRKRQWSQSVGRIQIILRASLYYLQDGLILIMSF